jgi:acetolactate synthase-1/2/3 large subunit
VTADAKAFLKAANERLLGRAVLDAGLVATRQANNTADRAAFEASSVVDDTSWDGPGVHPGRTVTTLRRVLPDDAIITTDAGNFASWVHRFFKHHGLASGQKTQLAPTVGSMGYGVPAGIAANLVSGRTAFTIAGDGDFLMNGQELATAVQHGGKSIIVLLNNGMYGTIRMHQEREYPKHESGSRLNNPDFAALARAYGYAGVRITRTAEFEAELLAALARQEGTVIEVTLDPEVITTRGTLSAITQNALKRPL